MDFGSDLDLEDDHFASFADWDIIDNGQFDNIPSYSPLPSTSTVSNTVIGDISSGISEPIASPYATKDLTPTRDGFGDFRKPATDIWGFTSYY